MNQDMKDFVTKFRLDDLTIYESEYWVWSVRTLQPTLGSSVLSLKRHAYKMSDITSAEAEDLKTIITIIENTTQEAFGYEIMNYLMLMMVDKHVHYHVIPRYGDAKKFGNKEWIDKGWPALPDLKAEKETDQMLLSIKETFLDCIKA